MCCIQCLCVYVAFSQVAVYAVLPGVSASLTHIPIYSITFLLVDIISSHIVAVWHCGEYYGVTLRSPIFSASMPRCVHVMPVVNCSSLALHFYYTLFFRLLYIAHRRPLTAYARVYMAVSIHSHVVASVPRAEGLFFHCNHFDACLCMLLCM